MWVLNMNAEILRLVSKQAQAVWNVYACKLWGLEEPADRASEPPGTLPPSPAFLLSAHRDTGRIVDERVPFGSQR